MPKKKYLPFNLDLFKPGDGLLIRNEGKAIGRGIELKQLQAGFPSEDARFTHIETLFLRDRKDISKFWSIRVAPPKTKLVDFPTFYKGKYVKIVRYKYYENFEKLAEVASWAATHCNLRYDWHGIFHFIFVWFKQHTSKWFCSESRCWSLQQVYLDAFSGLKPEKSMPAHFCSLEWSETIWKGIIP